MRGALVPRAGLFGLLAGALVAPAAAAVPVTDLGAWDGVGGFRPVAVSPNGAFVAGTRVVATSPDEFGHAARWTAAGGVVDFTAIGGAGSNRSSGALDVSDAGLVVGVSNTADDFAGEHAFRASSPSVVDLGVLDDTVFTPGATARGVSATGVIVGSSMRAIAAAEKVQGFRLSSGVLSLGATFPAADAAHDVFLFAVADGAAPAAVGARDWNPETQAGGTGFAVTGAGVVSALDFVPGRHGLSADGKWAAGTTAAAAARKRDLLAQPAAASVVLAPLAPATTGAVTSVNRDGVVAGASGGKAVVWRDSGAVDLNTLLDEGSGWVLQAALDISDTGLVLGYGTKGGVRHGFLIDASGDDAISVTTAGDQVDPSPTDGICDVDAGADGLQCTLRAAIQTANAKAGADRIEFAIPGAAEPVLRPATALPAITGPVVVDGTTQAGAARVRIDGKGAPAAAIGLRASAGGITLRGLVLGGFGGGGVELGAPGAAIEGSWIGVDAAGTSLGMGTAGVLARAATVRVGGATAAQAVVIQNVDGPGVDVAKGARATVRGNRIALVDGEPIALADEAPAAPYLRDLRDGVLRGQAEAAPNASLTLDVHAGLCQGSEGAGLDRVLVAGRALKADANGLATFKLTLPAGAGAAAAVVTDAKGATSPTSNLALDNPSPVSRAATGSGETCPIDTEVFALEPVQKVQVEDWFDVQDRTFGLPGFPYRVATTWMRPLFTGAVPIVAGVPGYLRMYVRNTRSSDVVPPRALLYAYREQPGSGRLVPLSPASVAPFSKPDRIRSKATLADLRGRAERTYNFALPPEWLVVGENLVLVGRTLANPFECEGERCAANNALALTGIDVVPTRALTVRAVAATWRDRRNGEAPGSTTESYATRALLAWFPVAPRDVRTVPAGVALDLTNPIISAQRIATAQSGPGVPEDGKLRSCWADRRGRDDGLAGCRRWFPDTAVDGLQAMAGDLRFPAGQLPLTITPNFDRLSGITGSTATTGRSATWLTVGHAGDGETVAHELMHQLGIEHVPGCGAKHPYADYPQASGRIASWGYAPPSGGTGAGVVYSPADTYDVMGYCGAPDHKWISAYIWRKLVFALEPPTRAPARSAAAPAVAALDVRAIVVGDAAVLAVDPAAGAAATADPASPIVLRSVDAAGATLRTDHVAIADVTDGDALHVAARVPAAGVAALELVRDTTVLARLERPAGAPTIRILDRRIRVRKGRDAIVRIAAGATVQRIDVAFAADGRTFAPVVVGAPRAATVRVPAALLARATRGRLRLTASDGFATATAVSVPFATPGAPPLVTITAPVRGPAVAKGARLTLVGYAYDDRGRALVGKSLRWLDGKRLVGRGAVVRTKALGAGVHRFRLVARDRFGRTASKTVSVRVRKA